MSGLLRWVGGLVVAIAIGMPAPISAQSDSGAALYAQVTELYKAGKYAEATPLAQRLVTIAEQAGGPDHPNVGTALSMLANLYVAQGRYADAEPLSRRALAIYERANGPDHPDVALMLGNLANIYQSQNRDADAEPLYKRSLAIREKALGSDHPEVAQSLDNLAILYHGEARYADAEPLYQRALGIFEKALGPNDPDVARALNNLAGLYRDKGRYRAAEPLYKRALAIYERALGPDHPDLAPPLYNLGGLYRQQARYTEAEPLYQRALAIREARLGPNHPNVGQSLNSLANLYENENRHADAEPLYQRSLAINEAALGPDHPEVASTLNNLALLYQNQARYADAEPLCMRALAIYERALGPDHPDLARALSNLAFLYQKQSRYADAEPLYQRALAIYEKALGPDHPDFARALNSLGFLYQQQGRYEDAEPLYRRSAAISEKTLGSDHPEVVRPLSNLAELYVIQGRYADALPVAKRLVASGGADARDVLPSLFGAQRSGLISPEEAMDDSLNVIQRSAQTSVASAINKLAVRLAAGNDRLAQLVRQDQDLAGEAEALGKTIIAAVSREPSRRDAVSEERIKARLAAIAAARDALQKVLATEFPDYAALSSPLPLKVAQVQELLSDGEGMVVFSAGGDKESYVLALTRDGMDWKSISLGGDALARKVADFRRGLDGTMVEDQAVLDALDVKRELFDLDVANQLYEVLLGPVEALIKDKRHLLVVPFGPLTALPFHLLITEKPTAGTPSVKGNLTANDMAPYRDAAWLAKRQAVSVMPSVASLKALRWFARKDQASKPMIGFGNPVFSTGGAVATQRGRTKTASRNLVTRSFADFWRGAGVDRDRLGAALPQLPDTADEIKAVARRLHTSRADIHLGRDASEATVKHAPLAAYRIVYFATHGLVAGDIKDLAEPSLALTIPRQPSDLDDGLLTASEVAQLKLNADWVVLSACNTIAGDRPGAEALSGLARSFFYAGARALLVTHWPIATDAATRITVATFGILKADPTLGRAEALRRAMLAYANDTSRPTDAYPAIWGPFSIIGEGAAH